MSRARRITYDDAIVINKDGEVVINNRERALHGVMAFGSVERGVQELARRHRLTPAQAEQLAALIEGLVNPGD